MQGGINEKGILHSSEEMIQSASKARWQQKKGKKDSGVSTMLLI